MNATSIYQVLLFIAEISGHTKLMISSDPEIKGGQLIISELIQAILKEVEMQLVVSKLDGDAICIFSIKDSDRFTPAHVRKTTGEILYRASLPHELASLQRG